MGSNHMNHETTSSSNYNTSENSNVIFKYLIDKGYQSLESTSPNSENNQLKSINEKSGYVPLLVFIWHGILATLREKSMPFEQLQDFSKDLNGAIRENRNARWDINKILNDRNSGIEKKVIHIEKYPIFLLLDALLVTHRDSYDDFQNVPMQVNDLITYLKRPEFAHPTKQVLETKNATAWVDKHTKTAYEKNSGIFIDQSKKQPLNDASHNKNKVIVKELLGEFLKRALRHPELLRISTNDEFEPSVFWCKKDHEKFIEYKKLLNDPESITDTKIQAVIAIKTERRRGGFSNFFSSSTDSQKQYEEIKNYYESRSLTK